MTPKPETLMELVEHFDNLHPSQRNCGVVLERADWLRISAALRAACSSIDSLFQAIEHGDKEHRKWLWTKLDEHFAEFRALVGTKGGER